MRTTVILAALLVASLIAIALLVRRVRFWKGIAQESQTSTTYWREKYQDQVSFNHHARLGERSPVSVEREGPSRWTDVERVARTGRIS